MSRFRKKPVVIEAVRLPLKQAEVCPEWFIRASAEGKLYRDALGTRISTLEGIMLSIDGDWIIQGVAGELYPCKPDIFEKTYEPVEGA